MADFWRVRDRNTLHGSGDCPSLQRQRSRHHPLLPVTSGAAPPMGHVRWRTCARCLDGRTLRMLEPAPLSASARLESLDD